MVFSSSVFLMAFLPVTLLIYFLTPAKYVKARNLVLLIASLVFYGWGEPKYILIMIVSIISNYFLALLIARAKAGGSMGSARAFLVIDIIVNLGLLGFFKYTDFLIETVNSLIHSDLSLLGIALPIGISFYTFQTMSYVIDVYRGKVEVQRDFLTLACYVALFPQLIAGPIVRYSDCEKALKARTSDPERVSEGIRRFIFGFAKKILIANQMAVVWEEIYGMTEAGLQIGVGLGWIGAIAFTFQIYFDFSGYSDMAIGLGRIFGFDYLENFNYPYISATITEFWRRWHMSLSSWFRDYVYIPLGGNRKGLIRQLVNIAVVWALTGLWHGASWNFVLWGVYYGVLLITEKLFLLKILDRIPGKLAFIKHVYTLVLVTLGWVLFKITDFGDLMVYLGYMFGRGHPDPHVFVYYLSSYWPLFLTAGLCSTPLVKNLWTGILSRRPDDTAWDKLETAVLAILFIVSIAFLVSGSYNPFLYFRF
ncbi:MAG: MBOAT family protein [Firmicutes bacterium]|nr:MBOAT family protein [Bacillota bacterium]